MLKIGEFSKLARISIQMLRHYDEIGILKPSAVDAATGYRYYNSDQLPTANKILSLKDMGLGLSSIKDILELPQADNAVQSYKDSLEAHQKKLEMEISHLRHKLALTQSTIEALADSDQNSYHVSIKDIPEMDVISVRGIIERYDREGILWEKVFQEMAVHGLKPAAPPYFIAIMHDQCFKEDHVDIEIQCAVSPANINPQLSGLKKRAAVKVAGVTYQGPYTKLYEINTAIVQWITRNDYVLSGPEFNIYHTSPNRHKDPENFVTEVCYPIMAKDFE